MDSLLQLSSADWAAMGFWLLFGGAFAVLFPGWYH